MAPRSPRLSLIQFASSRLRRRAPHDAERGPLPAAGHQLGERVQVARRGVRRERDALPQALDAAVLAVEAQAGRPPPSRSIRAIPPPPRGM